MNLRLSVSVCLALGMMLSPAETPAQYVQFDSPCWGIVFNWVGNVELSIDNAGGLGIGYYDCLGEYRTGIEFPAHSGVQFGAASLWVGGIRDGETLVSQYGEFAPGLCPEGNLKLRTSLPFLRGPIGSRRCPDLYRDDSAVSELDLVGVYSDTLIDPGWIRYDAIDGRAHRPLGVQVQQTVYIWSPEYAQDFVTAEFVIRNIGPNASERQAEVETTLRGVYLALGGQVYARSRRTLSAEISDDLVGFLQSGATPLRPELSQLLNVLWMADNDGDMTVGPHGVGAVTGVLGIAPLTNPPGHGRVSFNWWTSSYVPELEWGPVRRYSEVEFPQGGLGGPKGDRAKYQMMSNGEIDYPQVETAINHEGSGWLPPPSDPAQAENIADGGSMGFLLSVGPFDVPRDSEVIFAVALVGGENFHTDPNNLRQNFDPQNPSTYLSRLDLSDLLRNVQWARWVYDNPGVDTDRDGFAGNYFLQGDDTVYYQGDGVPDRRGALPPTPPLVEYEVSAGRVILHWNGERTETEEDVFTLRPDFEGYRVYMNRTGNDNDWLYLAQRDLVNYGRHTWTGSRGRWELLDPPFTLDSLKAIYDTLTLSRYGFEFHVDRFKVPTLDEALLEIHFDPDHPASVDSVYRYFTPFDANNTPDDSGLARAVAAGLDVTGVIRKVHPEADPTAVEYREDGPAFRPFFEYEYVIDGLQVAEPVFIAVTAFDHGDPASRLASLESSRSVTAAEVWPINSATVVNTERPKPGVYPNPYRTAEMYYDRGWENRTGLEPDRERARQVTFYNVPDTCSVSIWSLDGDLVKELTHRAHPSSSEASVVVWNLITRNTQAVKTGIYIWSIESRHGTDVGKLVIIK